MQCNSYSARGLEMTRSHFGVIVLNLMDTKKLQRNLGLSEDYKK